MKYQKPLQGIRAFAVLIVVLNHLSITGFSGGFIGVDVFFVISGYLITGLLVEEYVQDGRISISEFYFRRVRRILPALVVTVVFTSFAGFLLLSEERLSLLIDSSLAAIFSVSNIYFWSQIGYFDIEALEKPLLHTWSLGVEEQFYIVWPVFIVFLAKLKSINTISYGVLALSLFSFLLSMYVFGWGVPEALYSGYGFSASFEDGVSSAFYLMPFRIFEFGVGAMLGVAYFKKQPKISAGLSDFLFLLSGCILAFAVVYLNKDSVFPFHNALLVSIASALAIYSSFSSRLASLLLANKVMVFIGGISYSLYLVHWPIISYYSILFGLPSLLESVGLFLIMLAVALAMFRFVEQPARKIGFFNSFSSFFSKFTLKVTFGLGMVGIAFLLNGMKDVNWRIPESRETLKNAEWRALERRIYCQDEIDGFPEEIFTCQNDRGSEKTVIAWGDSHALHLVAGLSELYPEYNVAIAYISGCIPQSGFKGFVRNFPTESGTQACIDLNYAFLDWADSYNGEALIFITSAKRDRPERISEINRTLVRRIEKSQHDVFVLGDFIRPGNQIAQCRSVPDFLLSDEFLKTVCGPDEKSVNSEISYSERMEYLSEKYIPIHKSQCYEGECRFSDEEGRATYRDYHHLSIYGSIYEMKKASDLIFQYTGGDFGR
ncbi:acyltransferase family protein [uncultured Halomonas sp.]|uniref:acyltransferase family protein n=1 Tax=uncultured Halomonas sp. TaxID=173971 RepID=UPI0026108B38|nr:acyltransferase family protein [uncultured Halomonas sp.]